MYCWRRSDGEGYGGGIGEKCIQVFSEEVEHEDRGDSAGGGGGGGRFDICVANLVYKEMARYHTQTIISLLET